MKQILVGIIAWVVVINAGAKESASEWQQLSSLLEDCTGYFDDASRLTDVPGEKWTDGPLLGNGEIGATFAGDGISQTVYVNRNDNWAWSLGGVTITAPERGRIPARLVKKFYASYEQRLAASEVISHVDLNGNPTLIKSWVSIQSPLLVQEINNRSDKPVTYEIQTWSRPPLMPSKLPMPGHPFCFKPWASPFIAMCEEPDQSIKVRPYSLKQNHWPLPEAYRNAYWMLEDAGDGAWYVRNYTTRNYLAAAENGRLKTVTEPEGDGSARWQMQPAYMGFHMVDEKLGHPISCEEDDPYALRVYTYKGDLTDHRSWLHKRRTWQFEYPERLFSAAHAGTDGTVTWAFRENRSTNYLSRGTITSRVIGAPFTTKNDLIRVTIPPRETATLLVAVDGEGGRSDELDALDVYLQRGSERVLDAADELAALDAERVSWWKDFWMQSWVDLGSRTLNQFWYGAYYALGCFTRAGKPEGCALWGPWVTTDNPEWGNENTNNYNHQSTYYGVCTGNRLSLLLPYVENTLAHLPYFKHRTASAGYRGAVFQRMTDYPANMGKLPDPVPVAPTKDRAALGNDQLDALTFIVLNIIAYYEHTLDINFLRDKCYPLAIECIDFFEDYLTFEDGRYVLYDSAAREFLKDEVNAGYQLAYIRRLAAFCIRASQDLSVDESRREKWQHILDHLSAYPTIELDGKTLLKESENRDEVSHRWNGVHDTSCTLQIVYPGEQIGMETKTTDPALWQSAWNHFEQLNKLPDLPAWIQFNNFPMVLPQLVYLGCDPEWLLDELEFSIKPYFRNNLTVHIGGGGIETVGATAAINAMLMQSHESAIYLFPVWPKNRDVQFKRLRAKGAFLVSAELCEGEILPVEIYSEKGAALRMKNPWPGKAVTLVSDKETALRFDGEFLEFPTVPDTQYRLSPEF